MANEGEAASSAANSDTPLISVVILTYNGGDLLKDCLFQVFHQEIEDPFEVVLVDSGSSDGSGELQALYPVRLFRIPTERFSYGYARSLGFAKSRGRYIATISQDFVPAADWLVRLTGPLREGEDVVQGGVTLPPGPRPFYWETRRFCFTSEGSDFHRRYGNVGLSCVNLATRKDVWQNTGFGEDTPMNEDKVFQRLLFEKGYRRIVFKPEATGYHGHQYNLKSLVRRCENEGFGWRWVGERYSAFQMVWDLVLPSSYAKLALGLLTGKIRSVSELLFIWIRPVAVFKGNRLDKAWKR